MDELADLTATEIRDAYRRKALSPVEATSATLLRMAQLDDTVNAFTHIDEDAALAQAQASEARWLAGKPSSPLDGVPASIKDVLLTKGWPTLRGSRLIDADQEWATDAPSVARLRESGAILVGKTASPEFGWKGVTDNTRTGNTGNPWDPSKTSGGSSGGSAAAVALGMAPLSVGTDGGGSVRIPAALSGIVGFKPTYGAVPNYPTSPYGTLSHIGPLTRTVEDAALMMDAITGFDSRDWSALPPPRTSFTAGLRDGVTGLRIGYSRDLGYVSVDGEVAAAVDAAVQVLADAGAIIENVDPGFSDPLDAYHALWFAGAGKVIMGYPEDRWDELDPGLLEVALAGQTLSAMDLLDANQVRADLGQRMGAFHEKFDLLVTPTVPIPAFDIGIEVPAGSGMTRWTEWTPFSYPFNLTQQPGLSVPCGLTSAGLPIGLQIVGPRTADALVLRAGATYEALVPFGRPPLVSRSATPVTH